MSGVQLGKGPRLRKLKKLLKVSGKMGSKKTREDQSMMLVWSLPKVWLREKVADVGVQFGEV